MEHKTEVKEGQGTEGEVIDSFDPELEKLLEQQNGSSDNKDNNSDNKEPDKSGSKEDGKLKTTLASTQQAAASSEESSLDTLSFLNEKLGLEIPEDNIKGLSIEEKQEATLEVLTNLVDNANKIVEEYTPIVEMIEADKELQAFIKLKQQGLTAEQVLKKIATEDSLDNKSPEDLVRDEILKANPDYTTEDIEAEIDALKKAGRFERKYESIKSRIEKTKAEALTKTAEEESNKLTKAAEEAEKEYQENLKSLYAYTSSLKEIDGITIDKSLQEGIIKAVSTRDEKTGLTLLDQALQSDEGVARAILGIFFLEDLMKAKSSVKTNETKKGLLERLYGSPEELQGNKKGGNNIGANSEELANSF